jgi:hypothetical protein
VAATDRFTVLMLDVMRCSFAIQVNWSAQDRAWCARSNRRDRQSSRSRRVSQEMTGGRPRAAAQVIRCGVAKAV